MLCSMKMASVWIALALGMALLAVATAQSGSGMGNVPDCAICQMDADCSSNKCDDTGACAASSSDVECVVAVSVVYVAYVTMVLCQVKCDVTSFWSVTPLTWA